MLLKSQMLTLTLSSLFIMPVHAMNAELQQQVKRIAQYLSNLNAENVQTQLKDNILKLEPVVAGLIRKVENKQFDDLADTISIDLSPAVDFLRDNMDTLKEVIKKGLPIAVNSLPAQIRDQAESANQMVLDNLDILGRLKTKLADIRDYSNLARYKGTIANTLKSIAESDKADELLQILKELKSELAPALELVRTIDTAVLNKAVKAAQDILNKEASGQTVKIADLTPIVAFINELRTKLAPAIPLLNAVLGEYAARINALAKQVARQNKDVVTLPKQVTSAVDFAKTQAAKLSDQIENLNDIIKALKEKGKALFPNV
jgi:hypothetical protein